MDLAEKRSLQVVSSCCEAYVIVGACHVLRLV